MAWIRRLGWAAAIGAGLLAAAFAAAWWLFDAERTKQLAVDWVQERTQRTLAIVQPVELALLPRPRLRLAGVSLSEPRRADIFAKVDAAELTPRLWPLLRGQVVVDRIELQGVQATLVRRRDGTRNTDDLAGGTAPAAPSASSSGTAVEIGRIRLRDLKLEVRDEAGGPAGRLALALLQADRLRVDGGTVSVAPLKLSIASLQSGTLTLDGATLDVAELSSGGTPRRLVLQDLRASATGRQGAQGFDVTLRWPRLMVGERVEGSPLEGEFRTRGPSALAGSLRSGPPAGDLAMLRVPGLVLSAKGRAGPREIDATLKGTLQLAMETSRLQLDGLDLQARLAEPGLQPVALALQGQAGGTAQALRWALHGTLNDNRLTADGELRLGGRVPSVQAKARFDRLDLNRLLAPAAGAASAPQPAAPADTPVDLEGLRAVDGRFALSAGELRFRQYVVAQAQLDAQLAGGKLTVSRLSGQAWGGQIDGQGSAQAEGSRIALALTANGVDVDALLHDVAGKDLLEGRGRISANLRGQGRTLGALRSSLAGDVRLQLRDGAVKGVNLAKAFRQAKAALTMKRDAVTQARSTEKTDFSELNVSARVDGGVATSDDLDLRSPFLRVGGAGRFDIGRGQVDYTARATVVAVPQGQDAGGLASLKGVTVPVRLSGPFDAIDWHIQWSAIAAAAVEQKVKEKVQQKLGDRLKGLFGR